MSWETLDVAALLVRREEATTSGNVGAYPVPLGARPLRAKMPVGLGSQYTLVPTGQRTQHESSYDQSYEWALQQLK